MLMVVYYIGNREFTGHRHGGKGTAVVFFLEKALRQHNIWNTLFGISSMAVESFINKSEVLS